VFEDLDSNGAPTITVKAGVISGVYGDAVTAGRTCGAELWAASSVPQAGGNVRSTVITGAAVTAAGMLGGNGLDIIPIGFGIVGASATPVVGAKMVMHALVIAPPPQF
jgi:hypothetical protein